MKLKSMYEEYDANKASAILNDLRKKMYDIRYMEKIFYKNQSFIDYISDKYLTSVTDIRIIKSEESTQGAINLIFHYKLILDNESDLKSIQICCKKYLPFFRRMPDKGFTKNMICRGIYEYAFIRKFEKLLTNSPRVKVIPTITYVRDFNMLIMEDVRKCSESVNNLKELVLNKSIPNKLGEVLGKIQGETYNLIDNWERPFIRLGKSKYHTPTIQKLLARKSTVSKNIYSFIESTIASKKTISHGDFSQKNIFIDKFDDVIIYDFEESNYDDPSEDISRWLANYFIFSLIDGENRIAIEKNIKSFMNTYKKACSNYDDLSKDLIGIEKRTVKNIGLFILYRLHSMNLSNINLQINQNIRDLFFNFGLSPFRYNLSTVNNYIEYMYDMVENEEKNVEKKC